MSAPLMDLHCIVSKEQTRERLLALMETSLWQLVQRLKRCHQILHFPDAKVISYTFLFTLLCLIIRLDVKECDLPNACGPHAKCSTPVINSRTCTCDQGYHIASDGTSNINIGKLTTPVKTIPGTTPWSASDDCIRKFFSFPLSFPKKSSSSRF